MGDTATQASIVGALLLQASDPLVGARALHRYLAHPSTESREMLEQAGVSPSQVGEFEPVLPTDYFALADACSAGAAWVLGRRSVSNVPQWSPVVTGSPAEGFERRTAETLVGLISEAKRSVRLFVSFVDVGGLSLLALPIAAATRRRVTVQVAFRAAPRHDDAVAELVRRVEADGEVSNLGIARLPQKDAFQHLKMLAVDGDRAYIGSANLTYAALTSNVELGALVHGDQVAIYETFFDSLVAGGQGASGDN